MTITTYRGPKVRLIKPPLPSEKALSLIKEKVSFPKELFLENLSTASLCPERVEEYHMRALSLLRKLVRNPTGIRTLSRKYRRPVRSSLKGSTKFMNARASVLRIIVSSLMESGLVTRIPKGLVATPSGVALLSAK